MISSGYFLAMGFGGWILAHFGWIWVFIVPSALILTMVVVDFFLVKDKPEQAGFPKINTDDATSHIGDDVKVGFTYVLKRAFANPVIITLMVAEFCTGFVRQGLMLWFTPFLKEIHHIAPGSGLHQVASLGITAGRHRRRAALRLHVRPPVPVAAAAGGVHLLHRPDHFAADPGRRARSRPGGLHDRLLLHVDLRRARHALGDGVDGLRRHARARPRSPACWTACSTWPAA